HPYKKYERNIVMFSTRFISKKLYPNFTQRFKTNNAFHFTVKNATDPANLTTFLNQFYQKDLMKILTTRDEDGLTPIDLIENNDNLKKHDRKKITTLQKDFLARNQEIKPLEQKI